MSVMPTDPTEIKRQLEELLVGTSPADHQRQLRELKAASDAAERNGHGGTMPAVLRFRTPAEIRASTPEEPDWLWEGYVASGSVTLLGGKPKIGKSTLTLAAVDAIASAAPSFLGRVITPTPVVFVSEENSPTIAHKLPNSELVRVLTREHAWPKPEWSELVAAAVDEATNHDAGLIVIDTLAYWAAMAAESEKDAGAAQAVMQPLLDAARHGLAFMVPVHERKGGGTDGEALRGSSAFAGGADIIIELGRLANPRQRQLLSLSRYPSTPGMLIVELDAATGGWSVIGEATERGDARAIVDRQALLAALNDAGPLTRIKLESAVGTPALQWHKTLEQLRTDGIVVRTGAGKKGDPHRFEMLRTDAAQGVCAACAETGDQVGFVSGALPVGEHQKRPSRAAPSKAAPCAEPCPEFDADAELARLTAKFPQEELDGLHPETGHSCPTPTIP